MKKILITGIFTITCNLVFAQQALRTKKLIVVTFDGYRWKEVFRGADSSKLFSKEFTSQDSAIKAKKFWGADLSERRKKLMPFFWNTIAAKGQLYGNRDLGNNVNTKNKYWFSYPGYNEIFTGYPDTLVNSNNFPPNPNFNVWEFINKQPDYKNQIAVFASWNAFYRILNQKRSGLMINAGFNDLKGSNLTDVQKTLNAQQHYLPKVFGEAERLDGTTFFLAKDYLKQNHPKVLQLSFIETDAFGHQGKYDFYLDAAHNNDAMIADLWNYIQSDPFYKDQTTLFIAVDHGRGEDAKWRNHSNTISYSNEIWFAVMGPDTPPLGEMKGPSQLYQYQYAKTLAALLGFDFTSVNPIGPVINSIFKK